MSLSVRSSASNCTRDRLALAVQPLRIAGRPCASAAAICRSARLPASILRTTRQVTVQPVQALGNNSSGQYDYDLVIIGCGVGGHGAALHAVEQGMKVAIVEGHDVGGTCVNRGCVPSKALLAAAGRLHEFRNEQHLKSMGIKVGQVQYDRQGIADHANGLAKTIQGNLRRSLEAIGVDILKGQGRLEDNHTVKYGLPGRVDIGGTVTARDIIIATGSVPFVPPGIEVDGKTVITSDHALKLEWVPEWMAIIGSGYIGLEMMDVFTALGTEVTFIEIFDKLMPGFDVDMQRQAQRLIVDSKPGVDYRLGVMASKVTPGVPGIKPVTVELVDFKTKKPVEPLEVDCCLVATGRAPYSAGLNIKAVGAELDRRGFIPVNDKMEVLDGSGNAIPHVYAIGDVTGKYMLAHAASAQGIVAVENMLGRTREVNYNSIPAAVFTHPEISSVGMTEEKAKELAAAEGFKVAVAKTSFKANSKALAEREGDGIAKLIYRKDTGEILGVHIIGLHAADLIHEASNAVAAGMTVNDLKFNVHAHPTLSEVLEELFRQCHVDAPAAAAAAASNTKEPVAA